MKIYAGIVTFNPEICRLNQNIEAIIGQVEKILIIDNNSNNVKEFERAIYKSDKIKFIKLDKNIGIAGALNRLFEVAKIQHVDWLLTLDQDSICPPNIIAKLEPYLNEKVGIISPKIFYKNNEITDSNKKGLEEINWVITSASLTNVDAWNNIDGFDEKLFIDGVDKDFCIRLRRYGFSVLINNDITLEHELGNLKAIKRFSRIIYVTHHSPLRKYYMARNVVYLDKKLGIKDAPEYLLKLLIKTTIYEKQKLFKISRIFLGIIDGFKLAKEIE